MNNAITQSKKVNFSILITSAFLIFLTAMLIINPAKYINSCYNGLVIWVSCVLPSLFPFFVITKLLTELKSLDKFFGKFEKVNKLLFNAPRCSGYIFGMSIISGYPVGAKLISDFYENEVISSRQANKLTTFCSTSGPLFIIGTVGAIMLGDIRLGYILYASHILSAILNGILFRKAYASNDENKMDKSKPTDYSTMLSRVMTNSIMSVMVVGGFVAMFYMIIDILADTNIILPLQKLLELIFSPLGLKQVANSLSFGIIEVTRGCKELASLSIPLITKTTICSGVITFGGMSIHAQSLSFLTKAKVSTKFYFAQKITQTIFACVICYLLCLIFL